MSRLTRTRASAPRPTGELLAGARGATGKKSRWNHVRALHRRPEEQVFQAARAWCSTGNALERALGADILGQLGAGVGRPYREQSLPLLWSLTMDAEPAVIESAVAALGHLELCGDVAGLRPLASHPCTDVRHAVAFALGGEQCELALDMLIQLSEDADTDVRDWATFGLGTLCDVDSPRVRAALSARLQDADEETRGEALLGLARRGDARVVRPLLDELQSDGVGVLAVEAAGEIAAPELLPALKDLATWWRDEDGKLEEAIACCARKGH